MQVRQIAATRSKCSDILFDNAVRRTATLELAELNTLLFGNFYGPKARGFQPPSSSEWSGFIL